AAHRGHPGRQRDADQCIRWHPDRLCDHRCGRQIVRRLGATTCGRSPCAPLGVAASADGATVFVSLFDIDQVLGIDSTMMNLVDDIAMVGTSPLGLAVTPDTKDVYVANMNGASVSVIEVSSCGPVCNVTTIDNGLVNEPNLIAITPDGASAFVGGF